MMDSDRYVLMLICFLKIDSNFYILVVIRVCVSYASVETNQTNVNL